MAYIGVKESCWLSCENVEETKENDGKREEEREKKERTLCFQPFLCATAVLKGT